MGRIGEEQLAAAVRPPHAELAEALHGALSDAREARQLLQGSEQLASLRLRRLLAQHRLQRSDTSAKSTPPGVSFLLRIWSKRNCFAAVAVAVWRGWRFCFFGPILHRAVAKSLCRHAPPAPRRRQPSGERSLGSPRVCAKF